MVWARHPAGLDGDAAAGATRAGAPRRDRRVASACRSCGGTAGGETHYRLDIVASAFEGKSRVERHRLVNAVLDDAFKRGLHALAVRARTPAEAA